MAPAHIPMLLSQKPSIKDGIIRLQFTLVSYRTAQQQSTTGGVRAADPPPELAGLFSQGGEVMKLHKEGSLTILASGIKRVSLWEY